MPSRLPESRWEYRVINKETGKTLSTHTIPQFAQAARDVANRQELQNGRQAIFEVKPYSFSRT